VSTSDNARSVRGLLLQGTAIAIIAYRVIVLPTPAFAQPSPHNERNPIGSLIDQDYFTAALYPEVKNELNTVELYHVNDRDWKAYFDHQYEAPLGDCKFALGYFPNHPRVLFLLGEIAKAINQPSMPIEYFERALQLYPQYAFTHAQYGRYLIEIGGLNAGIAELREAVRLDPNLLQAQEWLAEALPPGAAGSDSSGSKAKGPGGSRGN
jgi:tetratricopeptide (TPR) repeat protein